MISRSVIEIFKASKDRKLSRLAEEYIRNLDLLNHYRYGWAVALAKKNLREIEREIRRHLVDLEMGALVDDIMEISDITNLIDGMREDLQALMDRHR